jgi:hypothetical protein
MRFVDDKLADTLLSLPLKSLQPSLSYHSHLLFNREPYQDLQNLVMKGVREPGLAVDFILKHNRLQKLYITSWNDEQDEWDRLLSGMSTFTNLRSLFLLWSGPSGRTFDFKPTRQALVAISELKGLEQLAIGCATGDNSGDSMETYDPDADDNQVPQWLIDHDEVRAHLSSRKGLKKLALIGDTYRPSDNHPRHPWYYVDAIPPEQD